MAGNQEQTMSVIHLLSPLHAVCSRDGVQLDTIGGLLDVGLFVHVFLAGTMLHVSWSFGLRMFRVFQTEVNMQPLSCDLMWPRVTSYDSM